MITLNLHDEIFGHEPLGYSVAGQKSENMIWDRSHKNKGLPTFYSHAKIKDVNTSRKNSYALLFESQSIDPWSYRMAEELHDKFNLIFTHSSELLNKYSNTRWIPGGGVWIGGDHGKGEVGIKEKTKLCSMVSSDKSMCQLHLIRADIANQYKNHEKIKIFGTLLGEWVEIHKTLDDFMFSIIVENFIDELYFTEKILNCFATGTIPIYLGARDIGQKFNKEGVLQFSSPDELESQIEDMSPNLYKDRFDAIRDNLNEVKKYTTIEDFIIKNYSKEL